MNTEKLDGPHPPVPIAPTRPLEATQTHGVKKTFVPSDVNDSRVVAPLTLPPTVTCQENHRYRMTTETNEDAQTVLSPEEAFGVLGNDTRMSILRVLGEADEPLPFSKLHDAVDVRDSGQFNYHLDKLHGHFVEKTHDGYELRQAGYRVIEAVLSGAITETSEVEPTQIDQSCPHCGAPLEMTYRDETVHLFCTKCPGTYGGEGSTTKTTTPKKKNGHIGDVLLPPAGVRDRTPPEITSTAMTWTNLEIAAATSGICPRCSAPFEQSVQVCDTHDRSDALCEDCGRRYAAIIDNQCTNCTFRYQGTTELVLLDDMVFLQYLIDHDVNPISPSPERYLALEMGFEESILSTDPFRARLAFTLDEETLKLTVDQDLTVVDTERTDASETA